MEIPKEIQRLQEDIRTIRKANMDTLDLIYRKTGPSLIGVNGQSILNGSIPNTSVINRSRTFDAMVDSEGNAEFTNLNDAMDYVISIGGGDIFVFPGTYSITTAPPTINVPINTIGTNLALTTIDFGASARNFVVNSGTAYTTGTISSIAADKVTVTGSGTSWLGNVTAGQYIFLGTRWYLIAAVTANTTLILAEAYIDDIALSAYRVTALTRGVSFESMTITGSTSTAIATTDCRDITLRDVLFLSNNKGFSLTNVSQPNINTTVCAASTSNGFEMTNVGLGFVAGLASNGNGGSGGVLNNVKVVNFQSSAAETNVADGMNLTSCDTVALEYVASGNGGQGIELVSGNREIDITAHASNNVSDGVKLTATSDFCKISLGHYDTNGGWGINIAAADCDKNVAIGNSFNANTSGTINDAGTGSVVTPNTT